MGLNIQLECSSFPEVATALQAAGLAAVLPTLAEVELSPMGIKVIELPALRSLTREICLAWNPRFLGIRTALEKARRAFEETFQI